MTPEPSQNGTDSPLFHADSATLVFAAQKDGKIRVTGHCIPDYLSVAPDHAFEVRWGPQGVEGRVVARNVVAPVDGPDPFWVPDAKPKRRSLAELLPGRQGEFPPEVLAELDKLPTLSAADIAVIKSAGGPVLVAKTKGAE